MTYPLCGLNFVAFPPFPERTYLLKAMAWPHSRLARLLYAEMSYLRELLLFLRARISRLFLPYFAPLKSWAFHFHPAMGLQLLFP